jgi:hypothetical protein
MVFRTSVCCAVVALALAAGADSATACEGSACARTATVKPLNLMQFMHRAKTGTIRHSHARGGLARIRRTHPDDTAAVVPMPRPAPLPAEAASAFAEQSKPDAQIAGVGAFATVDGLGAPASKATVGAAPPGGLGAPDVQVVAANDFNDLDRKAQQAWQVSHPAPSNVQPATEKSLADASWTHRLWLMLIGGWSALAQTAHDLIG